MQAVNQYIVIEKIKQERTKVAGLELTEELDSDNRYAKGKVVTCGRFAEGVKDGDIVHYDKHVGHSIRYNDNVYEVITIRDVVLVGWE